MRRLVRVVVPAVAFATPIAIGIYHSAKNFGAWDNISVRYNPWWLAIYGITFVIAAFLFGVPALVERPRQAFISSLLAAGTPWAVASMFFVVYDPLIPRLVVVGTPAVLFVAFLAASMLHAALSRRSEQTDRVLFVIGEQEQAYLESDLERRAERRFSVAAVHRPEAMKATDALRDAASATDANLVVLSAAAEQSEAIVAQASQLHDRGLRVRNLFMFYEEWLGKFPVGELERTSLWFDIRDVHELHYTRMKRVMDLTVGVVLLPLFVLSMPFVYLVNLAGNRGTLFFRQARVGQHGTRFTMWKYRTMTGHAESEGRGQWTEVDDPRITRFGKLLRKSHLDELPQVVNVLRGHLSVVGPRPEQVHYVEELRSKIPFYDLRHVVKPGITGWAQVMYPYGASEEDAFEKLQYDLYYLKHQSPTLDVRVCARTLRTMFFGEGR